MNAIYVILAASTVPLLSVTAFFVFIVVGVRRGDRRDLRSPANDRIEAITRHVIGAGGRNGANDTEGGS
jgi:hypothetical protein